MLAYEVTAQVGGKIAQLGARLIDATAKQMADAFFNRFAALVAGVRRRGGGCRGAAAGATRALMAPPTRSALPLAVWGAAPARACCSGSGAAVRKPPVVLPASVADTAALLAAGGYVADPALATTVHLALAMQRPLFLEGEPGTGKTEIAKVLAAGLNRRLVRLQCYDGMDLSAAAYEWDHARQLMAIRIAEADRHGRPAGAGQRHLQPAPSCRPARCCRAIDPDLPPAVLLIDELDRADEPFEAFLLEVLADFQLTHSRIRHRAGRHAAGGGDHLQPHPRGARRHPPALPVPLGGLPRRRAGAADPGPQGARRAGAAVGADRRLRAAPARRGAVQAARRGRDDRLGGGADPSGQARARPRGGGRNAGRVAEIPGRHRQNQRRRSRPAGGRGGAAAAA